MKISIISAFSDHHVIGLDNKMPWHLPADLKRFKSLTMGAAILMGRKTYESIGRPLPGRTTLIISRDAHYNQPGCLTFNSFELAVEKATEITDELFVIGGAALYKSALPIANTLYLTLINALFEGDAYFPAIEWSDWRETSLINHDDDPEVSFSYQFLTLEKVISASLPS